jgi:transposase-like protein
MTLPPFCPNPRCACHDRTVAVKTGNFYIHKGSYSTQVSGTVQRFQCRFCGRGFSERTTSIDYYTKRNISYRHIWDSINGGESVSAIARHTGFSPQSVQNRIDRLGRSSIAMHRRLVSTISLNEHLCADGFESFDKSQYFPNNIDILVGVESQFLYANTHVSMRRKGCMTKKQRKLREAIDKEWKPRPRAGETAFLDLLKTIEPIWKLNKFPSLILRTDEHKAYPRAINRAPFLVIARNEKRFSHEQYSSKAERNEHNPLFPVNYYDRELRKDIAAYHRQSTCYGRSVSNGLLRLATYVTWHNYDKKHRIYWVKAPGNRHSDVAGINRQLVEEEFSRLFVERGFLSHAKLTREEKRIWLKQKKTPLKREKEYVPLYAYAGA